VQLRVGKGEGDRKLKVGRYLAGAILDEARCTHRHLEAVDSSAAAGRDVRGGGQQLGLWGHAVVGSVAGTLLRQH
jgi:hypothetical protein